MSAAQLGQKSRNHLKILGAIMVTWDEFRTGNPQILCTTVQIVFSRRPGARELCTLSHWGFRGIFCLYLERRIIKSGNL